jgi:23S rRNA (adenine-C8)-methyltransferase
MRVLNHHAKVTNRRIFLAYLLLPGVNDTTDHAKGVLDLVDRHIEPRFRYLFHVNILRYNDAQGITDESFQRTSAEQLQRFVDSIKTKMSVTIRQSFGLDIDAACGQLHQLAKRGAKLKDTQ